MWMGFFQVDKSVYNVFLRVGKSVCDVLSELANMYVMFCPSWQICM